MVAAAFSRRSLVAALVLAVVLPGAAVAQPAAFPYRDGDFVDPRTLPGVAPSAGLARIQIGIVGNPARLTHGVVLLHGDGPADYLRSVLGTPTSPTEDRRRLEASLGPGQGMIFAFPRSRTSQWSGFSYQGSNGGTILALFAFLLRATGNPDLVCHLGGMSGGSLPLNSFLNAVDTHYDRNASVRAFVDRNLRTMSDHDALCRPVAMQTRGYIRAATRFPHVRFNFVHGHGGKMAYVRRAHEKVGRGVADPGFSLPYHCPRVLALRDGQLRFWSAPSHWLAFKGQIHETIFGGNRPGRPPRPDPGGTIAVRPPAAQPGPIPTVPGPNPLPRAHAPGILGM